MKLEFVIDNGKGRNYTINFWRNGDDLTAVCNCQAGSKGLYCRHRFALMDGLPDSIVSGNASDLSVLREMMRDTDVERCYEHMIDASHTIDIRILKSSLAKSMYHYVSKDELDETVDYLHYNRESLQQIDVDKKGIFY